MRQLLISTFIIVLASIYVLFLNQLAESSRVTQKAIVIPLFLLLILYYFIKPSWKKLTQNRSKWFLLFVITLLIQLLVLATGSLTSPFLILIHFCMIGLSFIFSFSTSLIFLIASFAVIILDITLHQNFPLITQNPTPLLLHIASLIPIISVAYIISQHYRIKDVLFKKLHTQYIAAEVVLKHLNELIFITDSEFRILSANDAAVRALQQSRSELLNKPIFNILLLRDKNGKKVNEKTFFPKPGDLANPKVIHDPFTLIGSSFTPRNGTVLIKPILDIDNKVNQISFIISFNNQMQSEKSFNDMLGKARTKYEATAENIKRTLNSPSLQEIKKEMIMLQKIESDIFNIQYLKDFSNANSITKVDVAQICKQISQSEQELASALRVPFKFEIKNFGQKDIAPLVVDNFKVSPDQLTGPFFTVSCNITYLEVVIKKLIELLLLLSATLKKPNVVLNIERNTDDDIVVTGIALCPELTKEDLQNIYVPYYGSLANRTFLYSGSGLEGYLLKSASDASGFMLDIQYDKTPNSEIKIILKIKKLNHKKTHP